MDLVQQIFERTQALITFRQEHPKTLVYKIRERNTGSEFDHVQSEEKAIRELLPQGWHLEWVGSSTLSSYEIEITYAQRCDPIIIPIEGLPYLQQLGFHFEEKQ